jgi:hypothetical protein
LISYLVEFLEAHSVMKIIMAEYGDWDSIFKLGSHYLCERFLEQGATVLWLRSYWSMFTPAAAWRGFKVSLRQKEKFVRLFSFNVASVQKPSRL